MKKYKKYLKLGICFIILSVVFAMCYGVDNLITRDYEINQMNAKGYVSSLIDSERRFYIENKRYGTLEEIYNDVPREELESLKSRNGYKFSIDIDEKSFTIRAIPIEYGKTGKLSYFFDSKDELLRGDDKKGELATFTDKVIKQIALNK
jgi:hypothetical protein